MSENIHPFVKQLMMLRLFQLLNRLASSSATTSELAELINVSERTVYRYFFLLEEIGFCVKRTGYGGQTRYSLSTEAYPDFIKVFLKTIEK